jgi:hypothetical protein
MSTTTRRRSVPLTAAQHVILASATRRRNRGVVRPAQISESAFSDAARQLLARGLIEEVEARPDQLPAKGGRGSTALRLTDAGLAAIGKPEKTTRHRDAQPGPARRRGSRPRKIVPKVAPTAAVAPSQKVDGGDNASVARRPGTKRALLIALLSRPEGASLAQMAAATDWLPHTTRAALTRLRQSGCAIERSDRADGAVVYQLVSSSITATNGAAA